MVDAEFGQKSNLTKALLVWNGVDSMGDDVAVPV